MRKALVVSTFLALTSVAAFAEQWTGRLVDATCAEQNKAAACEPTSSTTAFVLNAGGKMMKLDAAGNSKAADALKTRENSANRSKDPGSGIMATVKGTLNGDEIQVDSIVVR